MKYLPFGETRTGSVPTDKLFTGQRLDGTGLYYYNARCYDPQIGRFISADTFVQWSTGVDVISYPLIVNAIPIGLGSVRAPQGNYPESTKQATVNPQNLNRYSYAFNNPLRYNDPTGNWPPFLDNLSSKAKDLMDQGVEAAKEGLKVAVTKTVEIYQAAKQIPGQVKEAAMHAVGIERVEYYNPKNLGEIVVPVYHLNEEGIIGATLDAFGYAGFSAYPMGTFLREKYVSEKYKEHESKHYSEQAIWGILWYLGYGIEIIARTAYYWDIKSAYLSSSFEQRAMEHANQPEPVIPAPRWQPYMKSYMDYMSQYICLYK